MKKLYEIEVELIFYVMANNEDAAKKAALKNIKDECDSLTSFDLSAIQPTNLFANWQDSYPYEADDNNTVGEIFAREKKEREIKEKEQMKLFTA